MASETKTAPIPGEMLIDGRTCFRQMVECRASGIMVPLWQMTPPDPRPKSYNVERFGGVSCHAKFDRLTGPGGIAAAPLVDDNDQTPIANELVKVRGMGLPLLADALAGLVGWKPSGGFTGVFPAGPVWVAKNLPAFGVMSDVVKSLLDRHASGDLGLNGKLGDATLTDQSRFFPTWQTSYDVRGAVALEQGEGAVVSRYDLGPDPRPNRAKSRLVVTIATAVSVKGNRTVVAEESAGAHTLAD
jgi:hypothetical protein